MAERSAPASRGRAPLEIPDPREDEEGFVAGTLEMFAAIGSPRYPIPEDHPEGQYSLMASVADDKGTTGGHSGSWYFVIGKPGACS